MPFNVLSVVSSYSTTVSMPTNGGIVYMPFSVPSVVSYSTAVPVTSRDVAIVPSSSTTIPIPSDGRIVYSTTMSFSVHSASA